MIVPNYQTAESQEKRKNNPRKRYTIESRQAMTAYEFADSISKTLRIPVGAANMIVMNQNNISSLDRYYTHFKVNTLGRKQALTSEQENSLLFTETHTSKQSQFEQKIIKKTDTEEISKKETSSYSEVEKSQNTQTIIPSKQKTTKNPSQSVPSSGNTYKESEKVQKLYGT